MSVSLCFNSALMWCWTLHMLWLAYVVPPAPDIAPQCKHVLIKVWNLPSGSPFTSTSRFRCADRGMGTEPNQIPALFDHGSM